MIFIDLIEDEVQITFPKSEYFFEIVDLLKKKHLKFSYETKIKYWTGTNSQIFNIIPLLNEIEECIVSNKVAEFVKPIPRIKFERNIFDNKLLKQSPLGNYQIDGIKYLISSNGIICGDECGTGKTYQLISAINHLWLKKFDRIFIVAVPEVLYNWQRELLMFSDLFEESDIVIANKDNRNPFLNNPKIILSSYNTLNLIAKNFSSKFTKNSRKEVIPFKEWGTSKLIILDECFEYNTIVNTDLGNLKIGYIVENRLNCRVLSYNFESKLEEYKYIVNYKKNLLNSRLMTIKFSNGSYINCTENHKIWSISLNKYKLAKELFNGEKVYARKFLRNLQKRTNKNSNSQTHKMLQPQMWSHLEIKISKRSNLHKRKIFKNTGINRKKSRKQSREMGETFSKQLQKNERKQSILQTRDYHKNERNKRKKRIIACLDWAEGRKWKIFKSAAIFKKKFRRQLDIGVSNKNKGSNSRRRIWKLPNKLQSGYCKFRFKNSFRSRWRRPSIKKSYSQRLQKRILHKTVRVENIKIYKYRDRSEFRNSKGKNYVYNLEVEKNHNYFANNILVSNCHNIKGRDSLRSKILHLHKNNFEYRWLATGTPYPNNCSELYSLLNFLDENIINKDYISFLESIANLGNRFSQYAINYFYEDKVKLFIDSIKPYIFRRFKKDVLPNLPALNIKKIFVKMNDKQRIIYQKIISATLQSLKEEKGDLLIKDVISKFPYLLLSCSDPCILENKIMDKGSEYNLLLSQEIQNLINKWKFTDNSKLEALESIIEENIEENKIIIWSYHPKVSEKLKEYFKKYNPIIIHGQIKSDLDKDVYRDKQLELFKNSKCNLAILSPLCMGVGVNIKEATISIFFDRDFDIKTFEQALGRNHRANSTKEVTAYILINDKTLENYCDFKLEKKSSLNQLLLKGDTLSKEEWKNIFEGYDNYLEN